MQTSREMFALNEIIAAIESNPDDFSIYDTRRCLNGIAERLGVTGQLFSACQAAKLVLQPGTRERDNYGYTIMPAGWTHPERLLAYTPARAIRFLSILRDENTIDWDRAIREA